MKKSVLFLTAILILSLSTVCYGVVDVTVFDETFLRGTGEPVTEYRTFTGISGTATITLTNGGLEDTDIEKVSSCIVTINGVALFGPADFNQNVDVLVREVTLNDGDNILEVLLKSRPGGKLTVQIVQTVDADEDGDGFEGSLGTGEDCNDSDATIYPGAIEVCDGIDNDCSPDTPDGAGENWYGTQTTCGTGVCGGIGELTCTAGIQEDTCIENNPTETPEISCTDGQDNDCDGYTDGYDADCVLVSYYCDDDSDGYFDSSVDGTCYGTGCEPTGCQTTAGADCNDCNNAVYEGAAELCDSIDNNCDGQIDEGCGTTTVTLDFEDQDLSDWVIAENKTGVASHRIVPGNLDGTGNYLLEVEADNTPNDNTSEWMASYYLPSEPWSDYSVSFDFELVSGTYTYMLFYFYSQSTNDLDNAYRIAAAPVQNRLRLLKFENGSYTILYTYDYDFSSGVTYHIDVEAVNGQIRVYLDSSLVIDVADSTYSSGAFGLGTSNAGLESDRLVHYDNIVVELQEQTDINAGLVAYYPFDCDATDASGNGNHGTEYGGALYVDGATGQGVSFDGVDDYVDIDAVASSINGLGVGSFSLWFRGNSQASPFGGTPLWFNYHSYLAVGGYDGHLPESSIGFHTVDGFNMAYQNGNSYYYDDKWHNVTVVVGADYNAMYLDGVKLPVDYDQYGGQGDQNTGNVLWKTRDPITQVWLGGRPPELHNGSFFGFNGSVDEVRIYNRALSESEIGILYNLGNGQGCTNDKIVFRRSDYIWIMNADGSNQTQLTTSPNHETYPAISPDGTTIAYIDYTNADLMLMDVDGSNQRVLYDSSVIIGWPAWSPDGTEISYMEGPYNDYDIWVINLDDGSRRSLTDSGNSWVTSWSPDGSRIAYGHDNSSIWTMDSLDGGNKISLNAGVDYPDWSPDGSKIVYMNGYNPGDIWAVDPNNPSNKESIITSSADEWNPKWSPLGDKIAFTRDNDIYTVDHLTGEERRLTSTGDNDLGDWAVVCD